MPGLLLFSFCSCTNSGHPVGMWLRREPHLVLWTLSQCSLMLCASCTEGRHSCSWKCGFTALGAHRVFLGAQGMCIPKKQFSSLLVPVLEWGRILGRMETLELSPSSSPPSSEEVRTSLWLGPCPGQLPSSRGTT